MKDKQYISLFSKLDVYCYFQILKQMWPYVGTYVKDMLKETMEPSIRESLPSYLQSFRFEKILLGDMVYIVF